MTIGAAHIARTQGLSLLVAAEIRAWLGRRGLSASDMARALNVSAQWVSARLRGKQEIGLNDLAAMADYLDVDPLELVTAATRQLKSRAEMDTLRYQFREGRRCNAVGARSAKGHPAGRRRDGYVSVTSRLLARHLRIWAAT